MGSEDASLFIEKNEYLENMYSSVEPYFFYRDIFPKGSFERQGYYDDNKPNGIAVIINKDKFKRVTITDELNQVEELIKNNFVILNGIGYFGKERTMRNGSMLHAMIFDIDGLSDMSKLKNLISHVSTGISPLPTYIVNSGHGVHLYYVFEEPIPLYNHLKEPLKKMKYLLTARLWNMYVSDIKEVQYQGLNQGFRMVGSPTKFGKDHRVTAFKVGEKVTLDYLNNFISEEADKVKHIQYKSTMSLSEAKEKFPDWYQKKIIEKRKDSYWVVKEDLYLWWIRKIKDGATYGHRYFCIMALSIFAVKCNISYDRLKRDAMDLIPFLNNLNPEEPFTEKDVLSALNSYSDSYKNFPREDIEKITAIEIPKNKRNGRPQKLHLQIARATRDIVNPDWRGNKSKEELVIQYIKENPRESPTQIARALNVSRPTVYKYLKKYKDEL